MLIKNSDDVITVNGEVLEVGDGHGFILMEFDERADGMNSGLVSKASLMMLTSAIKTIEQTLDENIAETVPEPLIALTKQILLDSINQVK